MGSAIVAWSGGKDAALALRRCRVRGVDVAGLLTLMTADTGRSKTHDVPRACHERQAAALGVPIEFVDLPAAPSNATYERHLTTALTDWADRGVDRIVYADVHLADVRAYREDVLADTPLAGRWPLWGEAPGRLARAFLDAGFEATVVAVDGCTLGPEHVGRRFDDRFLADLPAGVDACGEAGAFHTFVHDGPGFDAPVPFETGGTTTRRVGDPGVPYHYAECRLGG